MTVKLVRTRAASLCLIAGGALLAGCGSSAPNDAQSASSGSVSPPVVAPAPPVAPAPAPPPAPPAGNAPPTIAGAPPAAVTPGRSYAFTPRASDADGDPLRFAVERAPGWARFDAATGALTGTPGSADVGSYRDVTVSVSDGRASSTLPPFTITVQAVANGAASLSWAPPTTQDDGSPLTDLAGYRVIYGTSAAALSESVRVANPGVTRHLLDNLSPATWYFAVIAYSQSGAESDPSPVISARIE